LAGKLNASTVLQLPQLLGRGKVIETRTCGKLVGYPDRPEIALGRNGPNDEIA
jgi:hypothetical protein